MKNVEWQQSCIVFPKNPEAAQCGPDCYWDGGIQPEEMTEFLRALQRQNIQIVIESGRGPQGYSTRILAYWRHWQQIESFYSISLDDRWRDVWRVRWRLRRLRRYVELIKGDSRTQLPELIRDLELFEPSSRIAILIDGPKAVTAQVLASDVIQFRNVVMVAIHGPPLPFSNRHHSLWIWERQQ